MGWRWGIVDAAEEIQTLHGNTIRMKVEEGLAADDVLVLGVGEMAV